MNSCVNPILYAFLSEPFRKSFRRLLVCRLRCGSLKSSAGGRREGGVTGTVIAGCSGRARLSPTDGKSVNCRAPESPMIGTGTAATSMRDQVINNGYTEVSGKTKFLLLPKTRLEDGDLEKEMDSCDMPLTDELETML